MRRIWLSSDFHLGHANIAGPYTSNWKQGYRDFSSVEEMNNTIIYNINKHVAKDDILFYHGDFAFGGHTHIPDYRRRIACETIHYILGNHDHHIPKYRDYFNSIQSYLETTLRLGERTIAFTMCHYSMRVWNGSHKGHMHTYGHSHDSLEWAPNGKSMDVGIDSAYRILGEYRPFSLEEVVDILDKRDVAFHDHHTAETNSR
jgi:calcineurin-like phosphoesterase family protein